MAIPPFNPNYPPDGSTLGQTKTTIRNNLDGTFLTLGVDHINNNGQPNAQPAGYHNVTHWVPQGADPATVAGYGQGYSKTVGADQQLFWKSGLGVVQQITSSTAPLVAATGYTTLPGGLIMQWGSIATPASGGPVAGNLVTFPLTFPTAVFSITLGPSRANTTNEVLTVNSATVTTVGFNVITGSNNYARVYWMAIGN